MRSYSLSMEFSLRRMMEECASLSKICRVAFCVYTSWGLNSSSTNLGSNIAPTTS